MKRIVSWMLLLGITFTLSAAPLKVLCIGNSFSDSLRRYLLSVVQSVDGLEIDLSMAIIGGSDFNHHLDMIDAFAKDGKSRPYHGNKTLEELLTAREWDVITLQQHSDPGPEWRGDNRLEPAGSRLLAYVRKFAPNAKIMVQQTWAYRFDDPHFGTMWPITPKAMYFQLRDAQRAFAERHQLYLIPTGDAVERARETQAKPFKEFDKNIVKTLKAGQVPDQTGSMVCGYSWGTGADGKPKLELDAHHLNARGQYLQACVWLAALYNRSPREVKFVPAELTAEDAAFMRQVAHDVWQETKAEHRL